MPAKKTSGTPKKVTLAPAQRMIKVSQSTIDSMKSMGMTKAIAKANSGKASEEFVEGAKRMYGKRVQPAARPSANVEKPKPKAGPEKPKKNVTGKGRATGVR